MTLSSEAYTPAKIADSRLLFNIPIYQRLFAWEQKQIEGLLMDLYLHFKKYSDVDSKDKNYAYYIGNLTCFMHNSRYDLIDGQQRFTVLSLMSIAFNDYTEPNEWSTFLHNKDVDRRIIFTARDEDADYLYGIEKGNTPKNYVNKLMENGIVYIKDFFHKCDDEGKPLFKDELSKRQFVTNIFNRLSLFFTEIPASYGNNPASLNKYFEAMNSSGKALEQHEILKVKLLANIVGDNEKRNNYTLLWNCVSEFRKELFYSDDYVNYTDKYQYVLNLLRSGNIFESLNELCVSKFDGSSDLTIAEIAPKALKNDNNRVSNDDESIINFPELLLITLRCMLPDSIEMSNYEFFKTDHLLSRFELLSPEDTEKFFQLLYYYRVILDTYVVRREISNYSGRYYINVEDSSDDESSNKLKLMQFETMLYVSTEYYKWLYPFFFFIRKEGDGVNCSKLLHFLKVEDNKRHPYSSFKKENRLYPHIDRYWFWRLDYYLWENRSNLYPTEGKDVEELEKYICKKDFINVIRLYTFRKNRSIEHLHPQTQTHTSDVWTEEQLNSFGNLAMISQEFNSEQSNDHLQLKFDRIHEQIETKSLQSIKMLFMCMEAKFDYRNWNWHNTSVHLFKMYRILISSYNATDQ